MSTAAASSIATIVEHSTAGWDLIFDAEHLELPNNCKLPARVELCFVMLKKGHGHVGIWRLEGRGLRDKTTIDRLVPKLGHGCQDRGLAACEAFLARHGYVPEGREFRRKGKR